MIKRARDTEPSRGTDRRLTPFRHIVRVMGGPAPGFTNVAGLRRHGVAEGAPADEAKALEIRTGETARTRELRLLAVRLEIHLSADAKDVDAIRVVARFILRQRFGGLAGR